MTDGKIAKTAEHRRLEATRLNKNNWKNWGPYLSERAWGTVREDYSEEGNAWEYFPHEHARSRTYRWNEDGIAGISDENQYLCFALALWNEKDSILKERMFGLTSTQGNHGEDVKEYYFYLDSTPTHSYMKMLYKYPQNPFPYEQLVEESKKRDRSKLEYELLDTGIFDQDEYFDVFVEFAKAAENDVLIEINIHNRSDHPSVCVALPTLWFRNTWSWGYPNGPMDDVPSKPKLKQQGSHAIEANHPVLGTYYLYTEDQNEFIFTENETNQQLLFGKPNHTPFVKDAFHRYLIHHDTGAVNPQKEGTKAASIHSYTIQAKDKVTIRLRLSNKPLSAPFKGFDRTMNLRKKEANEFYAAIQPPDLDDDNRMVQRQAFAGLLWSKQLYYYDVEHWMNADASPSPTTRSKQELRNQGWEHLINFDIISMPDKWEYPWYACWDLAFHCIPLVLIDPDFAKKQLTLMTREWYMHPNGQFPAYEWNFYDVNPPVHAWSAMRVYQIDAKMKGKPDRDFLKGVFHKLLLNFTWWVNRKDPQGKNVFQGGFLGLDNISVFDRSKPLPTGGQIDQSDGTAWMGFYCIEMMKIALELSLEEPIFQETATKFYEHFQRIAGAMNNCGGKGYSLWDDEDGFYYDCLHLPDGQIIPLKVRSLVGLLPLFAMEAIDPVMIKHAPLFASRLEWFTKRHADLYKHMACVFTPGIEKRRQMAIVTCDRLIRVLTYLFDENEFLSEYGIRSVSKYHQDHPYMLTVGGMTWEIAYEPAESKSWLYGGNSNWRGPVWFPINYLLIEALQRYHYYYGDGLKIEFPTGSGIKMNLNDIAKELSRRHMKLFLRNKEGKRPIFGGQKKFQTDPHWRDYILFYEYFHGDNGAGIGASHQTGWTGIIAKLIQQSGPEDRKEESGGAKTWFAQWADTIGATFRS